MLCDVLFEHLHDEAHDREDCVTPLRKILESCLSRRLSDISLAGVLLALNLLEFTVMTKRYTTIKKEVLDQRGFSVIELFVALMLLGIAAGILSPNIASIRSHHAHEGVSRQIAMEISKARMQAIAQNRTIRIRFDGTSSYVLESSEDGRIFEALGDPIVLPTGIQLSNGDTGLPRFNRRGVAPYSTTIVVNSSAGSSTIQTSLLGRVTRS